jgi:hypothetical protein
VKIRWTKDSVRFRITPDELKTLERGDAVHESFTSGASWHAAIVPTSGATELQFQADEMQIALGESDRAALSDPQNEGVYFQTQDDAVTSYLIEKDFPCAHPRAAEAMETTTETFSAPPGFQERINKNNL